MNDQNTNNRKKFIRSTEPDRFKFKDWFYALLVACFAIVLFMAFIAVAIACDGSERSERGADWAPRQVV